MKPFLVLLLSAASIVCSYVGYAKHSNLLMQTGCALSYVSLGAALMMVITIVERMVGT